MDIHCYIQVNGINFLNIPCKKCQSVLQDSPGHLSKETDQAIVDRLGVAYPTQGGGGFYREAAHSMAEATPEGEEIIKNENPWTGRYEQDRTHHLNQLTLILSLYHITVNPIWCGLSYNPKKQT